MKIFTAFGLKPVHLFAWLLGIAFLSLVLPPTASGELGGDATSVLADQAHMKAALKTTKAEAFTIHEIQAPSGTVVAPPASWGSPPSNPAALARRWASGGP